MKLASRSVSTAAITVAAENVIDSPTLVTDLTIASAAGRLAWIRSPSMLPWTLREPG